MGALIFAVVLMSNRNRLSNDEVEAAEEEPNAFGRNTSLEICPVHEQRAKSDFGMKREMLEELKKLIRKLTMKKMASVIAPTASTCSISCAN